MKDTCHIAKPGQFHYTKSPHFGCITKNWNHIYPLLCAKNSTNRENISHMQTESTKITALPQTSNN